MSNRKRKGLTMEKAIILWVFLFLLIPTLLPAQEFPTKIINLAVAGQAGGGLDVATRPLVKQAENFLGQPISVTNTPGGAGSVALGILAKDKPDGYHLVSCASSALVRIPHLRHVPYQLEDFIPIIQFASPEGGLVVRADSPWKTLKEFVEYAKKNPGKVNYSVFGIGSSMHLAMEFLAKQEGIQWTAIPAGAGLAFIPLLGGHVTACSGDSSWTPHVKAGTLRLLATYGEKRMKHFPEVPTFRELGYDFTQDTVFLVQAPKGTPPSIVKKLGEAFHKALGDPEVDQVLSKIETEVTYRNSEDTKKYLEEAYNRIGKMIIDLNIPKEVEKK
jgi:tripartite-type tricarboxylate transporter receptor subunit TctC